MIRAPYIENHNRRRTLHRLRTNRHAQLQIPQRQKPMASMGRDPNRPEARKPHAAFVRTIPVHPACTVRSKAPALPKSP